MTHHTIAITQIWNDLINSGVSDKVILGESLQPKDGNEEYLSAAATYTWYTAIGKYFTPSSILEVGTRFGYSLKSLVVGSTFGGTRIQGMEVSAYDTEEYEPGCLEIARTNLKSTGLKLDQINIYKQDTQTLSRFDELHYYDLIHIDGDHSFAGTYLDLYNAHQSLNDHGHIVVDDIELAECPGVKAAAQLFCIDKKYHYDHIPTYRGMWILSKK
jgi:predicted O-methyltransferase YrrM